MAATKCIVTACFFITIACVIGPERRNKESKRKKVPGEQRQLMFMLVSLELFGIGSFASSIFSIFCLDSTALLMKDVAHLVFILGQMIFFWYFGKETWHIALTDPRWHLVYAGLLVLQICVWLVASFEPLMLLEKPIQINASADIFESKCQIKSKLPINQGNQTCHKETAEIFRHFFEIFNVEYATIAISLLIHFWKTTVQPETNHLGECNQEESNSDGNLKQEVGGNPEAGGGRQPGRQEMGGNSKGKQKQHVGFPGEDNNNINTQNSINANNKKNGNLRTILVGSTELKIAWCVFAILGIGYVIIHMLCPRQNGISDPYAAFYVYNILQIVFVGISDAVLFYAIRYVLREKDWIEKECQGLDISKYLLYTISACDFIYFTYRLLAAAACLQIDKTVTVEAVVVLLWAIIALLNTGLQTFFLDFLGRKKQPPNWIQYFLVALFCLNIAEWLDRGFIHASSKSSRNPITPMMNGIFDEYTTQIITLVLYPVMNLFRFHSAMIALELFISKEWEQ